MNGPPTGSDEPTPREQVQLGTQVLDLEPESARAVRDAFQTLAASYGASLEEQRRQILSTIGTPGWTAPPPMAPELPAGVEVPDPDLLFTNKEAWAREFAQSLNTQLGQVKTENLGLVQGAVATVDRELQRRDMVTQARQLHDNAMEEMLDRRQLDGARDLVQTIYNTQYAALQHLPLGVAIDQIGQLAEERIAELRGVSPGARADPPPPPASPTPPALLSSGHRAARSHAAAPTHQPKTLSDLIRARQAAALGFGQAA